LALHPAFAGRRTIITSSRAFRFAGPQGIRRGRLTHNDVDHLMIYDAPHRCHGKLCASAIYGVEDLGFVQRGERAPSSPSATPPPAASCRSIPMGGGLSYMPSGMYGMYALQESVRQMRGSAPAQIPGAKISVCHGVGGMFAAAGTIIVSNEAL
jgi:hypothetical protein